MNTYVRSKVEEIEKGNFVVMGYDIFSNEWYFVKTTKTREEADRTAESKRNGALKLASDSSIADRYHIFEREDFLRNHLHLLED